MPVSWPAIQSKAADNQHRYLIHTSPSRSLSLPNHHSRDPRTSGTIEQQSSNNRGTTEEQSRAARGFLAHTPFPAPGGSATLAKSGRCPVCYAAQFSRGEHSLRRAASEILRRTLEQNWSEEGPLTPSLSPSDGGRGARR